MAYGLWQGTQDLSQAYGVQIMPPLAKDMIETTYRSCFPSFTLLCRKEVCVQLEIETLLRSTSFKNIPNSQYASIKGTEIEGQKGPHDNSSSMPVPPMLLTPKY